MRLIEFSRLAIFCVGAFICAEVAPAQTCQVRQQSLLTKGVTVGGYYSFSAIGNGLPGSLLLGGTGTGTGTTGTTPAFTNTEVGQLLGGLANTGPFSTSGILFLDSSGNILATPNAQGGVTTLVGTYTLNSSDCTITVTLRDAFGNNSTATNLQGVVVRDGSEIDLGVLQNLTTGTVCTVTTGTSTGTCTNTSTTTTTNTLFGTNTLVRLVRQQSPSCSTSNLVGSYVLLGNGNRVATVGTGTTQTQAPFFTFGLVQFDGAGKISSQSGTSSLSYLQYSGTYTVNADCTGTMTLSNAPNTSTSGATGGGTGSSTTGTSLNFILLQPSNARGVSSSPEISFSQASGTQTMFGVGIAQ